MKTLDKHSESARRVFEYLRQTRLSMTFCYMNGEEYAEDIAPNAASLAGLAARTNVINLVLPPEIYNRLVTVWVNVFQFSIGDVTQRLIREFGENFGALAICGESGTFWLRHNCPMSDSDRLKLSRTAVRYLKPMSMADVQFQETKMKTLPIFRSGEWLDTSSGGFDWKCFSPYSVHDIKKRLREQTKTEVAQLTQRRES